MSHPTLASVSPWRDRINGVLFVGLMAAAVTQIAGIAFVKSLGFSPVGRGHRMRHAIWQFPARHHAKGVE